MFCNSVEFLFFGCFFVPFLCQETDEIVENYWKYRAVFPCRAILFADIGTNENIYKIPEQFKSLCPCQRNRRYLLQIPAIFFVFLTFLAVSRFENHIPKKVFPLELFSTPKGFQKTSAFLPRFPASF